jgi:Zn-dependent hydrolases, including glyoxylases
MTEIETISTRSLGNSSHLLVSGDEAALVDPQRDAWRMLRACRSRGLTLRYVFETHVHNDYVSGALEVSAQTGAQVVAPRGGRYAFAHRAVADGDEIALGEVTVRAMETPGHTPEHTSYVVFGDGHPTPLAAFTGGSLMCGAAGRTDLLGDQHTAELTRAQYRSLRRLALLPDATPVLPTHGAGSFCAAGASAGGPTSTIGAERRTNPALLVADDADFVQERLALFAPHPTYYRHMAPINRTGPVLLGAPPTVPALSATTVARLVDAGVTVVDARDRRSFAAAHLPGSVNVELDDAFASYVGWVVPFGAPLVLVLPDPVAVSAAEAAAQLLRIGYDSVAGFLAGGVHRWQAAGRSVRSYRVAGIAQLAARLGQVHVLDVRQPRELQFGGIPGSLQIFVGDLPGRLADIPRSREVWTVCASGRRAALAASLLDRAQIPVTAVTSGGVPDLLARTA